MQQEIWFQKYRIIRLLGRGGNAKVYLAEHIKLNSFRAIKCISKNHPLYGLQLKEAQILKDLKHSCIPIIYDIEEDEDGSYIVEQYLEGETLKEYVKTKGSLHEDIIINFSVQLCNLIHYLHSIDRPVLYLDLKPENIIVTGVTLKLVDFGSAVFSDEVKEDQDFYGTRGYAAPELYRHDKIDERCDVYGIGMLMYYMVTGVSVSENTLLLENVDSIRHLPRYLKKIINRCLKFNPSQRFASVTQLSEQLSVNRKNKVRISEPDPSVRFAVAGAQPRIGVTHLSFRICSYFIHQGITCLYHENNDSRCVRQITKQYEGLNSKNGICEIEGIPMLGKEQADILAKPNYRIILEDYGCLTEDNMEQFLEADIKILVLGGKEWELEYAEQVLKIVTEYKDILFAFNYLDGRQYHLVMKSMDRRNCYRIPYDPDPYAAHRGDMDIELYRELTRLLSF